jgi:hypothetical protein
MQQQPAVDKLASRFGNSAIAKQAAQQVGPAAVVPRQGTLTTHAVAQ